MLLMDTYNFETCNTVHWVYRTPCDLLPAKKFTTVRPIRYTLQFKSWVAHRRSGGWLGLLIYRDTIKAKTFHDESGFHRNLKYMFYHDTSATLTTSFRLFLWLSMMFLFLVLRTRCI
jgi:hypothetical protein